MWFVVRFTDRTKGRVYPSTRTRKEGIMNSDNKDIVSGIVLWFAIIAIFAII